VAGITDGDGTEPEPGQQPSGQQQSGQQPATETRRDPRLGLMVARVFGIPVYISPYWFFVAALLVYLYANSLDADLSPTSVRYLVSAAFVVLLYVSVLIHELAHCAVARGFKLPVRRVLLYPLGGFSEIEEEPPTPSQEFLVSVAGPVISLALAGIAAVPGQPAGRHLQPAAGAAAGWRADLPGRHLEDHR
jgi:Zn-dependent protease